MSAPQLTYKVEFPGTAGKLSLTPPYDTCVVKFSCDQPYDTFLCRVTYGNEEWGKTKGLEIVEFNNRPAEVELNFTIFARNHLLEGDGTYRVSFYLLDTNNRWHYTGFYLSVLSADKQSRLTYKTSDSEAVDLSVAQTHHRVLMTNGYLKTSMQEYVFVELPPTEREFNVINSTSGKAEDVFVTFDDKDFYTSV